MRPALWLALALAATGPVYNNGGYSMATLAEVPLKVAVTFDFPSIAAAACGTTTLTVAGAVVDAACLVTHPIVTNGGSTIFRCHVATINTVTLSACCAGTLACNPNSSPFQVRVYN